MICCRNCAKTAVTLTVLAPLLTLVVLGVSHDKIGLSQNIRQEEGKPIQPIANHVKKQSNLITDSHGSLLFDPPLLDFGDCAVSVVWRQKVNIKNNRIHEKPINILSISGSSLHFHCSFVEDKVLESSANTSFEVVFLSREEGYVEDTLYIHTTRGSFPYRIQARGLPNPFLAKPFVNVRIPVNTTFSPLIHLYNPFASALQVLEMFGSSCDIHLEMPMGGERENESLDWWLIPPHQSKAIAKVNFLAMRAVNITAFVRIRTNYTAHPHGSLMLPISLEVTSQPLLFCPQQYLDFGVVDANDSPKTLKLFVINSGNRPITVQTVTAMPLSEGLSIEFNPVKVPPSLTTPTLVALVTFHPSSASQLRTTSGRIVVQSKSGQYKATVGYQITVAASYLRYNRSSTQFLASQHLQLPSCQPLSVDNEFALPVAVLSASLSVQEYIEARNFSQTVLRTREQGSLLQLCLVKMPPLLGTPFVANLHLKTNASAGLDIPVSVFSGKVVPIWRSEQEEDDPESKGNNATNRFIGWLTEGSSKEIHLALWNPNPVGVSLQGWGTNCSNAVLTYLGSESGTPSHFKNRFHYSNLTMATTVRPGSFAVFQLQILMQLDEAREGDFSSALIVHVRTVLETVAITLRYRTVSGSIRTIPAPLPWKANFLDPYLTTEVRLNSTLNESVTVVGFQAPAPFQHKLSFNLYNGNASSIIHAMQSAGVARLAYPLDWHCAASPLSKLVNDWQLGQQRWWNALGDLDLTTALYRCYESLSQSIWNQVASVKLVTKEIGFTEMPLRVDVNWPRLATKRRLHFPLTEMGRSSRMDLKLANPTASVVLAQILWLEDAQVEMKELVAKLPAHLTEGIELPSLGGLKKNKQHLKRSAFMLTEAEGDEHESQDSVMVYLTPGSQAQLSVTFSPTTDLKYRSLLVIKNNVTGLELVSLSGQGQSAKFLLANRKPGSSQPLLFDIGEQHLKNCEAGPNGGAWQSRFQYLLPSVTVKRTFTARNRGPFPITITGFDINQSPCEGYGFRVLQCQPLTLLPNQSLSMEVAFTPDFTQTRVVRTLRLHSTVGGQETPLNYTLMATLPTHMLVLCAAVLPRPNWELFFYYGSVAVSVFLLLCVVTAATVEADRILRSSVVSMVTVVAAHAASREGSDLEYSPSAGHLLDLRAVGKEASTQLSSPPVPAPTSVVPSPVEVSTKSTSGRGKKNKSKNKSRSALQSVAPLATVKSPPLAPWTPPAPKRSATPSPTISNSSQRSQTPPPSANVPPPPPTLPAPTLKVVTTKEETRLFKPKPNNKKTKSKSSASVHEETKATAKAVANAASPATSSPIATAAPSILAVASQQASNAQEIKTADDEPSGKRGRSSSVPSNNRNKTVTPNVHKSKNPPAPPKSSNKPPVAAVATSTNVTNVEASKKVTEIAATTVITSTTTTPVASVWQPRTHNKPLVKTPVTPLLQQTTNRPQPPVGKIIPEVRRVPEEHTVLPKPIGYRHPREKGSPPPSSPSSSTWNTDSQPWYNLSSSTSQASAQSGAWWPDGRSRSPHDRNQHEQQLESRDWLGLPRLTCDYTESTNIGSSMWPASSSYSSATAPDVWPEVQASPPASLLQTLNNTNPMNRVFSPWSVPHWFEVSRQQQRRNQEPLLHNGSPNMAMTNPQQTPNLGLVNNNGLWDSTITHNNNAPSNESWPSYSQF
ncbi:transmembrane protein 131-like [Daphnia carinata]|uniref:transmembrane protein 131-like n=1 Tax=Daphnia carinata TaxID=120202 RepID=UPI00258025E5|nr:transmembrane protein 131-like [Daphnia carinata]